VLPKPRLEDCGDGGRDINEFFYSRARLPVSVGSLPDEDKSDPGLEGQGVSRLGKGTTIRGTVSFGGSARIDGQVDGEITATGTLVIGETAVITTPRIKAALQS
jgi:hypothetical protein